MKQDARKTAPALLFAVLVHAFTVTSAQNKATKLQVGDNAPAITMYKWLKGEKVLNFKKGEVYVIEFGATWCTPCRAMIPHLSDIAKQYKGSVNVVSVFALEDMQVKPTDKNPAYVARVIKYVQQLDSIIHYTVGMDGPAKQMEKDWLDAAGLKGVPNTFIVDKDGKIAWIGIGAGELKKMLSLVTAKNYSLDAMLGLAMKKKLAEVPYNYVDPLLLNGNGGNDSDFVFRSVLVKSKGWLNGPQQLFIDSYNWSDEWVNDSAYNAEYYVRRRGMVQSVNMSLMALYYLAYGDTLSIDPNSRNPYRNNEYADTVKFPNFKLSYGKYWHEPVLEVKDKSPFYPKGYDADRRYHYSLKVQTGQPVTAGYLKERAQRDLQNYFGYQVTVENRQMPYWKLIVADTSKVNAGLLTKTPGKKLKWGDESTPPWTFTNVIMRDIIYMLSTTYGFGSFNYGKLSVEDQIPFIDETGIKGEIDLKFDRNWSFDDMRNYLAELGLVLVKSKKEMKVVVIRDPKE